MFLAGDETAASWIEAAERESNLLISSMTKMELVIGSRDKPHLKETLEFLTRFKIISINEQISDQASELVERYCLSHRLMISDAIIAATALVLDESLISRNQKDFRFIDGLKLLNYP
ncbi:MAG: type II toxin-antitoxin system VapC family toxin [Pyrinomonadaceae bacterium]